MTRINWVLTLAGVVLVACSVPGGVLAQQPINKTAVEQLSPEALDALVAGVAFYPDEVVEQALAAAFHPSAIRQAAALNNQQFQQVKSSFATSIVYLHERQPALLEQLNTHLELTARLGLAAQTQLEDVWAAVDRVREQYAASAEQQPEESFASSGVGYAYPAYGGFVAGLIVDDVLNELYYATTGTTYVGPHGGTVTTAGEVVVYDSTYTTAAAGQGSATATGPGGTTAEINAQGVAGATTYGDTTYFGSTGSGTASTSNGFYGQGSHQGEGSVTTHADGSNSFQRDGQTSLSSTYGSTDISHTGRGTASGHAPRTAAGSTHGDVSTATHASGGQATTTVTTENGQQTFIAGDGQITAGSSADSAARTGPSRTTTSRPNASTSTASSWLNGLNASQRNATQNAMAQAWGDLESKVQGRKREGANATSRDGGRADKVSSSPTGRLNSTARPTSRNGGSAINRNSHGNTVNHSGFNRNQNNGRNPSYGGGRSFSGGRGGRRR